LRAFRNLGEYRASVASDYQMNKNVTLDSIIAQYGEPARSDETNSATFEVCTGIADYETAVLNAFIPSYEEADDELKAIMTDMIAELEQISLR
jgi:hypothetical protein